MVEASPLRAQARRVKDLTEITIEELWQEVKEEEEWWGDIDAATLRGVKRLLEGSMEAELLEEVRAGAYRRTELRRDYRNGYRSRSLLTKFGLIEDLRVPRDREGRYQPTVLPRYQRRQERVNRPVREMFLQGVSTRKVEAVLEPLLGVSLSAQTVSRVTRTLECRGTTLPGAAPGGLLPVPAVGRHHPEGEGSLRGQEASGALCLWHYPRRATGDDQLPPGPV